MSLFDIQSHLKIYKLKRGNFYLWNTSTKIVLYNCNCPQFWHVRVEFVIKYILEGQCENLASLGKIPNFITVGTSTEWEKQGASMEEAKPVPQSRKRHLQHEIQDSPYYKMRGLLKDLRPHFIEVRFFLPISLFIVSSVNRILLRFFFTCPLAFLHLLYYCRTFFV